MHKFSVFVRSRFVVAASLAVFLSAGFALFVPAAADAAIQRGSVSYSNGRRTFSAGFVASSGSGTRYSYSPTTRYTYRPGSYSGYLGRYSGGYSGSRYSRSYSRTVYTTGYRYRYILSPGSRNLIRLPNSSPAPEPASQPAPVPEPTPTPVPQPADTPPAPQTTSAPAPAPSAPAAGLTADEQHMLDLVNAARAAAGLKPLEVDMRLVNTARMKSRDMVENNYFSHTSPTYGSAFELMRRSGASFTMAGENIAGNPSVDGAHQALMNSPGHRANILNPSFTHIGIGIVDGGRYGKMITQQFAREY